MDSYTKMKGKKREGKRKKNREDGNEAHKKFSRAFKCIEQRQASSERKGEREHERVRETKKRIKFIMMCVETKLALKSLF